VTIFDNCSRPEERDLLLERRGALRLLLADRNLGYGAAANLALSGDAELICVSNGDLLPGADALAALCAAATEEPRAGMVGPVFEGGSEHYHAPLPRPSTLLARTFIGRWGAGAARRPAEGETIEVGQVSGACVVMRRAVWERAGGFDDAFFLWYDDVDLARRLVDLGYANIVVGSALVRHGGAGSFGQLDGRTAQAIRLASLERYIAKHHGPWASVARPLLRLSRGLRARGAEVPGRGTGGEEAGAPKPGQVLEIRGDEIPELQRVGVAA
jgi:N-acetylglucosaminyl-diphospho-decaprenol L-rhamnosyltransferase